MAGEGGRRVLLIGWDAADWKVINPLMDAGKMPNLERVVNNGVIGNLATLTPDLSPMLWTSIATGKRPFKHGVLGFTEPDPHTGGIRPITNISRRTKAIWNILSQEGLKCAVVGWWPSHPVEPINGVMVSNHFATAVGPLDKPWPIRPGTVHPKRIEKHLAPLRWHPEKIEEGHILPFVPRAAEVDQDKDRRLSTLAKIICETCGIQDAALATLHNEPWDFAAVYFDGIDHFCHAFMRYHPPRLDWVSQEDFDLYSEVVSGGCILHDIILGKLLAQAGPDTTVLLISDHGFHSDHLRPRGVPNEPAGPAVQHRHYGIFAMMGPGVKKDERIYGASLLDVAPTVLTLLGLPVGADMDGKALLDALAAPPAIRTVPSWDRVEGPCGMHPPDMRIDPVEAREAIAQLAALGYIEPPGEDRAKTVEQTVRELDYNLARSYMDAGRHLEAVPLLERLWLRWEDEFRFGIHLARCYQAMERTAEARRLLEDVFRRKERVVASSRERLAVLARERGDRKPEDLYERERAELRDLRAKAAWNPYGLEVLMGTLRAEEGDHEGAIEHLRKAEAADPGQPGLFLQLGNAYLGLRRWDDADRSFRKALELDPDNSEAWLGLCRVALAQMRNREAADAAAASIRLLFHNPRAFLLLGTALHRMGEIHEAIRAMEMAIRQNPNLPEAHRRLAYIYRNRLHDHLKAGEHRMLAREAARRLRDLKQGKVRAAAKAGLGTGAQPGLSSGPPPETGRDDAAAVEGAVETPAAAESSGIGNEVIVVSGLPRSGTSMMMQMLAAGGLAVLTDGVRTPDADNPRGYFEFEQARRLREDPSWVPEARGKAVKVVAQLLPHLPPNPGYRVLFMERDMREVLESQNRMLARKDTAGAKLSEDGLARIFAAQINRVHTTMTERRIPFLTVSYADTVRSPAETAARVNRFLGGELDEAAMAQAVDPGLRRQRGGER